MNKKDISKFIDGFKEFQTKFFKTENSIFDKLSIGQNPKTLIIACSDSRVDPALLGAVDPGDIFVVRNIANIVPPYEEGGGKHGVSAAIEFAVINLKVENVIILGHRQCGGIKALLYPKETKAGGFVQKWMQTMEGAKEAAIKKVGSEDPEQLCRQCELEAIKVSIQNLKTFSFVNEAVNQRNLTLLGAYFDLEKGELLFLENDGEFKSVSD